MPAAGLHVVGLVQNTPSNKNICEFMDTLPKLWCKAGMGILNQQNVIEIKKSAKWLPWCHVAKRTPETFDVLLSGKSNRDFGKAVRSRFLQLTPGAAGAKQSLQCFLEQIDALSQPVLLG